MFSTLCWLFMVLVILVIYDSVWLDATMFSTLCWLFMVMVVLDNVGLFLQ